MPAYNYSLATMQPNDQLQPLDFVTPGSRGLNTVQAGALMDPSYCTTAQNAVIDTSARLAARQGASPVTFESTTLTWAAPPTGTTANLSAVFPGPSGVYITYFSDGEVRAVTYTNGSIATSWTGALVGTPTTVITSVSAGAIQVI